MGKEISSSVCQFYIKTTYIICWICDSGAMERGTSDKDTRDKVERMPLPQEPTTKWGIQI